MESLGFRGHGDSDTPAPEKREDALCLKPRNPELSPPGAPFERGPRPKP